MTPETPEGSLEQLEASEILDVAPPLPPKTSKARSPAVNENLPLLSDGHVINDIPHVQGHGLAIEGVLRV